MSLAYYRAAIYSIILASIMLTELFKPRLNNRALINNHYIWGNRYLKQLNDQKQHMTINEGKHVFQTGKSKGSRYIVYP